MGCVFCASGVAGLKRQMTDAEIVAQVLLGRRELGPDQRIRNVVFMGMGEPLHNYDAVARSLVLLTHADGLDLSKRRVTVSTSGLVKQIDRLGRDFDGQVQLAISLHAVRDEERSKIMPVNRKHGLGELTEALRRYPLSKRQRITIEYTLIDGVNDSVRDANGLVELLRGIPVKVNLIPMNPISASDLRAPDTSHVTRFQEQLTRRGLSVFIRKTRGDDVAAACGQLAFHGSPRRTRARRGCCRLGLETAARLERFDDVRSFLVHVVRGFDRLKAGVRPVPFDTKEGRIEKRGQLADEAFELHGGFAVHRLVDREPGQAGTRRRWRPHRARRCWC